MKTLAKLNILVLILIFFTSCYKTVEFVNVEKTDFNFGKGNNELILHFKLYNPNFYNLKIIHSDLKVFLNGTHIGDITSDEVFELKSKDTTLTNFNMDVNFVDIIGGLGQIIKSNNSEIRVKGYITAKTLLGKKIIEIDQKKSI